MSRLGCALGTLTVLAGCAAGPRAPSMLPFHVAVIPVGVTARSSEAVDTAFELDVDAEDFGRELASYLDGGAFARATLLAPAPAGDRSLQHWVAARAQLAPTTWSGASSSTRGWSSTSGNDLLWLGLLLFEFGGPAGWLLADRDYHAQAVLRTHFYDVHRFRSEDSSYVARHQLNRIDARQDRTSLNFLDRAHLGHYLLSALLPAGILARETARAESRLEQEIGASLREQLGQSIGNQREQLLVPDGARFWLAPDQPATLERSGGTVHVAVDVLVDADRREFLDEFTLVADRATRFPFDLRLAAPEPVASAADGGPAPVYRYRIRETIEVTGDSVQLIVQDTSRNGTRRTFTFQVAGEAGR